MLYKELNINQYQFAKKIGYTPGALSKIESGINKPSKKLIKIICDIDWPGHGYVNRDWLLTGKGKIFKEQGYPGTENLSVREIISPIYNPELKNIIDAVVEIMTSDDKITKDALKQNIIAFQQSVRNNKKINKLERDIEVLKSVLNPKNPGTKAKAK